MNTIEIPIRELHARTGHFVRKASENMRVIITDNGKPIAQINPISIDGDSKSKPLKWQNRRLVPGYAEFMNRRSGGTDSTQIISEDRDRGIDW